MEHAGGSLDTWISWLRVFWAANMVMDHSFQKNTRTKNKQPFWFEKGLTMGFDHGTYMTIHVCGTIAHPHYIPIVATYCIYIYISHDIHMSITYIPLYLWCLLFELNWWDGPRRSLNEFHGVSNRGLVNIFLEYIPTIEDIISSTRSSDVQNPKRDRKPTKHILRETNSLLGDAKLFNKLARFDYRR